MATNTSSRDIVLERRQILDFLLQDLAKQGVKFLIPQGQPLSSPSVLDNLNPNLFLKQVRHNGPLGQPVDLARCLFPPSTSLNGNDLSTAPPALPSSLSLDSRHSLQPVRSFNGVSTYAYSGSIVTGIGTGTNSTAPQLHTPLSNNDSDLFSKRMSNSSRQRPSAPVPASRSGSTGVVTDVKPLLSNNNPFAAIVEPSQVDGHLPALVECRQDDNRGQDLKLRMQSLQTGLHSTAINHLSYMLLFWVSSENASVDSRSASQPTAFQSTKTSGPAANVMNLLSVLRVQLGVKPGMAGGVADSMKHLSDGSVPWLAGRRVSLEALVRMLCCSRPSDFAAKPQLLTSYPPLMPKQDAGGVESVQCLAFHLFTEWQAILAAIIHTSFERNVTDGWSTADRSQAKRLLAVLKSSLRRLSLSQPDDFEESEYQEAGQAFTAVAGKLAGSCRMGWQLPWALRVGICDALLSGLFEKAPNDVSCQVNEAVTLSSLFEGQLYQPLCISPVLQLAVNAWVHFRQYVISPDTRLLRQLKYLMSKLLTQTEQRPDHSDPFGLGADVVSTDANRDDAHLNHDLAADVGRCIVEHTHLRFCDFYASFIRGEDMEGLLDVFCFASRSRGDGEIQLSETLIGFVKTSTAAELSRRADALTRRAGSQEESLSGLLRAVQELYNEQQQAARGHVHVLGACLGSSEYALLSASGVMYQVVGTQLTEWLKGVTSLDPTTLELMHCAMRADTLIGKALFEAAAEVLESVLVQAGSTGGASVQAGSTGGASVSYSPGSSMKGLPPVVKSMLQDFKRWDLSGPLRQALTQWVRSRVMDVATWTQRQLSMEQWKAVGESLGCAQFSVEVTRIMLDAADALFELRVPVSEDVLDILLSGFDEALSKCSKTLVDKLGPTSRLIPPRPPPTRFKQDLVARQEAAELAAAAGKPPPSSGGILSKAGGKFVAALKGSQSSSSKKPVDPTVTFLESVPKVESSPDFVHLTQGLSTPVLMVVIHSANYLLERTDNLTSSVSARWYEQQKSSGTSSTYASTAFVAERLIKSRSALDSAVSYGCSFLATKVVFWDLRHEWLELLYRHHVTTRRIDEVILEVLNAALFKVCSTMDEVLRQRFALCLLRCCATAMEWVLVDGGPCRWFIPTDVALIDADIVKLRDLFYAAGDGLTRPMIDEELVRLKRLLRVMSLEVGPLMEVLRDAKGRGSCTLAQTGKFPSVTLEEETVMRILARRPERLGSKLLKEDYKLSKRLK